MAEPYPFFIPPSYGDVDVATDADLHLAGQDSSGVGYDQFDVYGGEPGLGIDSNTERQFEHLPQFGPPFVAAVLQRFDRLEAQAAKELERWIFKDQTHVYTSSFVSSPTGSVDLATHPNCSILKVPPGFTFGLHRLTVIATGYTFGAPYTSAGSYWELRIDNEMILGNSMISGQGQIPIVGTWGTRDAPHVRDGEVLSFFMSGGPTSVSMTLKAQGTLRRNIEG